MADESAIRVLGNMVPNRADVGVGMHAPVAAVGLRVGWDRLLRESKRLLAVVTFDLF